MNKYYAVTAKCGHVRKNKYIEKVFAIRAENGKEAARIAKRLPRVKKNDLYSIINVNEITYDEYLALIEAIESDFYFKCESRQEQNRLCPDLYKYVKNEPKVFDRYDYEKKRKERLDRLFKKRKSFGIHFGGMHRLNRSDFA